MMREVEGGKDKPGGGDMSLNDLSKIKTHKLLLLTEQEIEYILGRF